jgi:hypothetical protein
MTSQFLTAGKLHSLESASLAVTFAAPLESSMDASAAKLWNHGLPSLKGAERDCGISG